MDDLNGLRIPEHVAIIWMETVVGRRLTACPEAWDTSRDVPPLRGFWRTLPGWVSVI